jgi:hypothetical protein
MGREKSFRVREEKNLLIPMSDGVSLAYSFNRMISTITREGEVRI